jgi:hypothetical protein
MARRGRKLVFLMHIWLADEEKNPTCRASLESVSNQDRLVFSSLEDLFLFIRKLAQTLEKNSAEQQGNEISSWEEARKRTEDL